MGRDQRLIIRGAGIGIILTATLFFLVMTFSVPKVLPGAMTDDQVIERAISLGMIFVSDFEQQITTDQQGIVQDIETTTTELPEITEHP
ncbi:MAG: hypothetical protein H7X94_04030 [Vallitaleaceae bacterium]|nr:hypothetical protein [Vallitaleaceae bacterium]